MTTGVCCVPVSPVRAEPSHKSEMTTQLLFGEGIEIIEKGADNWIQIRCLHDDYTGWITRPHITDLPELVTKEKITSGCRLE